MKSLYIMRHGIAVEHGAPGYADDERPLTPKGRSRVRRTARGLGRMGLRPDRIVSSPLPRASATARIVARALSVRDRTEMADVLRPGVDQARVRDWLRERPENRLIIVGHNPALNELIWILTAGPDRPGGTIFNLKKGGIAALEAPSDAPPSSTAPDHFELLWVATPGLVRRLSRGARRSGRSR